MKKLFLFKGTISGKTALFRYFLIIVFSVIFSYLYIDEFNIMFAIREQEYSDLISYLLLFGVLSYLEFTTTYKRLCSFKNSKNWIGRYLSNYAGELVGLFIMITIALELDLKIRGFEWDQLMIIYLIFFVLFAIIPSLINSPISDHKEHKG